MGNNRRDRALRRDGPPRPPVDPRPWRQRMFEFRQPDISDLDGKPSPTPTPPLNVFDRHISASLVLKRVVMLPSLPLDLCHALDTYSKQLDAIPDDVFGVDEHFYHSGMATDAVSLATSRQYGLNHEACCISSALIFNPRRPNMPLLYGRALIADTPTILRSTYVSQNYSIYPEVPARDPKSRKLLGRLQAYSEGLTSGMYFSRAALPLLGEMESLASRPTFPWQFDSLSSRSVVPDAPPPDAPTSLWKLPQETKEGLRRSSRRKATENLYAFPELGDLTPLQHGIVDGHQPVCAEYIQKV